MISLNGITKSYKTISTTKIVLDNIHYIFKPGINVGILGRNGAGKSTLLRIIGGTELPDSGIVHRRCRISWPIGFAGGFHGSLTGRENLRFTCRIFKADISQVTEFVKDFAELDEYMDMPIKTYSSGMRAKLAFGLSMALDFDFYLIDEITAVGDASFQSKCSAIFEERRSRSTLIVVSHNVETIKQYCQIAAILDHGNLSLFENMDEAFKSYWDICNGKTSIQNQ
ncbi:MAG: ABC transporter ATP-binding protein [Deltaproteobacteria bacterium]|nr:ABC transporter ATP-binding protein [Deltaproteobacteria bacterium]